MKDVSRKIRTLRTAVARAVVLMAPASVVLIREGKIPKGDALTVARVAGVQAAKDTSRIIPYCHPLSVDHVDVGFALETDRVIVTVGVSAIEKTGVEMEALTGAAAAALTIYDMVKMVDAALSIGGIELVEKHGGKSERKPVPAGLRAAVLVSSDAVSAGRRKDDSGPIIVERLKDLGVAVASVEVVPDEAEPLRTALLRAADELAVDLILTTGGTGAGPRDVLPEVTAGVIERDLPGVVEAARAFGQERTPYAMLSRGHAGVRGRTLIVNLPGSPRAVEESLDALLPQILHAIPMMRGGGH